MVTKSATKWVVQLSLSPGVFSILVVGDDVDSLKAFCCRYEQARAEIENVQMEWDQDYGHDWYAVASKNVWYFISSHVDVSGTEIYGECTLIVKEES